MAYDPASFVIPDHRRPGAAMAPLPLKVPGASAALLQAHADRLHTSRTALGRALLLRALAELEAASPAESGESTDAAEVVR